MFDPTTGRFVNLRTAIKLPACGKFALPFDVVASISAVALVNPVPLLTNVGFAKTPLPICGTRSTSSTLLGSVIVIVGATV